MAQLGRPTKYKKEYDSQVKKLCELGATDTQIADFFEIDVATLNRWKIKHKSFCASLKLGKEIPDENVVRALYHRATGYEHEDTDIRVVNNEIVETPIKKHYPPDATSMIFWLKNRRPDLWRDKPDFTGEDEDAKPLTITFQVKPPAAEIKVTNAKS